MPNIYEYFGFIFLFHSDDHWPMHVHVRHAEYESKLEFNYKDGKLHDIKIIKVSGKKHLPTKYLNEAIRFVKIKESDIALKWAEFYIKNKRLKMERITKKL